jgi:hypothetical protein
MSGRLKSNIDSRGKPKAQDRFKTRPPLILLLLKSSVNSRIFNSLLAAVP